MTHATFKYHHLPDYKTTIGYRINDADNTVTAAISHVAPMDAYNKAIGRAIVTGRILKGGINAHGNVRTYTFKLDDIGSTRYRDIIRHIKAKILLL